MITTYIHVHTKQINDRDQEPDKEDEYGLFSLILFLTIYIFKMCNMMINIHTHFGMILKSRQLAHPSPHILNFFCVCVGGVGVIILKIYSQGLSRMLYLK